MQKNKIIALLALIFAVMTCSAMKYQIKYLNTPTIFINNKNLKVGDWFNDDAVIYWKSDNQAMRVLSKDNKVYTISSRKYRESGSKRFSDFIAVSKPLASRGAFTTFANKLKGWANTNRHFSWLMLDETLVSFDDEDFKVPENIRFLLKINSDSENLIETQRVNNGFIISREALEPYIQYDNQDLKFTLFIRDASTGEEEEISDNFLIEILPTEISVQ